MKEGKDKMCYHCNCCQAHYSNCTCSCKVKKPIGIGDIVEIFDFSYVPGNWNPTSNSSCIEIAKPNRYWIVTEEGHLWGLRPVNIPSLLNTPDGEFCPGVNFPTDKPFMVSPYFVGKSDNNGLYCPKHCVRRIA